MAPTPCPKLSILILTYSRHPWLRAQLATLERQTGYDPQEVEVIVSEDAGPVPEEISAVVREYQDRFDIKFIRQPQRHTNLIHLYHALHECCGEYVWALGDDDFFYPGAVATVLSVADSRHQLITLNCTGWMPEEAFVPEPGLFPEGIPSSVRIPRTEDAELARVSDLHWDNEMLYSGNYAIVLRRDHYVKALAPAVTAGKLGDNVLSTLPHSQYILTEMLDEPAYYIGEPMVLCNLRVGWDNSNFGPIISAVRELYHRTKTFPAADV